MFIWLSVRVVEVTLFHAVPTPAHIVIVVVPVSAGAFLRRCWRALIVSVGKITVIRPLAAVVDVVPTCWPLVYCVEETLRDDLRDGRWPAGTKNPLLAGKTH